MSLAQFLKGFIKERLDAAAEEIFTEINKKIVQYEEEHKLLEILLQPRIEIQRIDHPQHDVLREKEVVIDKLFCNGERNLSLDQEEPDLQQREKEKGQDPKEIELVQIKECMDEIEIQQINNNEEGPESFHVNEEHEESEPRQITDEKKDFEPCDMADERQVPETIQTKEEEIDVSLEKDQLGLDQQSDTFTVNPPYEERDHSEPNPYGNVVIQIASELKNQKLQSRYNCDYEESKEEELKEIERCPETTSQGDNVRSSKAPCGVCGKFLTRPGLVGHMRIHTGEKPYSCLTCEKRFSHKGSLPRHMRTHSRKKPILCKICGKSFKCERGIYYHLTVHTGERPFSCGTCGKLFSHRSNLTNHSITHTGEKPFHCMFCEKPFAMKSHLTAHMYKDKGRKRHSCVACGEEFLCRGILSKHMKTHGREKLFLCLTCGKRFTSRSNLVQHKKIHTGERRF